jgi:hypothetical protein
MKTVLDSIFGTYSPVMTVIPVVDGSGTVVSVPVVAGGFAGVDWTYILGILLFGIVLYCVFRIFGAILSR